MKLLGSTILILTLALISACQKNDGGGDGGNSTPAAQVPVLPPGTPTNTEPYNNLSGPSYEPIYNREYLIYNTDGMLASNCDADPTLVCQKQGTRVVKTPIREFTMMSTPAYLSCLNNYSPIQDIANFNIRGACARDAMRVYSTSSIQKTSSSTKLAKSCAIQNPDPTAVKTVFYFDDRGVLNFSATVGIGEFNYLYRATAIGYKFNAKKNSLIIGSFMARGNNPTSRYMSVNSISGLRQPNQPYLSNMLLKESDVLGLSDLEVGLSGGAGYRFSEAILFRLSNHDNSPLSYQQFSNGMRGGPQQQFGGQQQQFGIVPQQQFGGLNQQGQRYMPNDPRFAQVDPRFAGITNGETKFLVAGGNLLLVPVELLSSINTLNRTTGGLPTYREFHDPR